MRVHRVLADAAADLLKSVFRERRVLDQQLATAFKQNPKWGKRDRAFIAETVYEVARWRRSLAFVADCEEISALCAAQWRRMGAGIPDWWNHGGATEADMEVREKQLPEQARAIRESVPDWLDQWAVDEMGEETWSRELAALNQRAPVYLRVNRLKCEPEEALDWLRREGLEVDPVPELADALVMAEGKVLPKPMRADGRIEIQDAGSQCIVPLLDARPGERIIDACSGAGGKALQLAAEMGNEGRIYAMDVEEAKLTELKRRARRAGASCIVVKPITGTTAHDFEHVADRLLIDAPCSGLGTLKRQPDLKWRLRPAAIERARAIQRELLGEYSRMLKPGGRLVYATCSILPSENREAVDTLLAAGGFKLLEELFISPAKQGCDGFYAAALLKEG
ncbi:MAG: class I SAM-dependent methyltransferase [Akkermansiaceae bacterium]|nr:class I SAM-dependent methyltransferase [Akkermansiaceae bacterium]